jgi:hypothetical protein
MPRPSRKELEQRIKELEAEILQLRKQCDRIAEIRRMDGRFGGRPLV